MSQLVIAKLLHLVAISIWIGGGLHAILDARYSLRREKPHLEAFVERMRAAGRTLLAAGLVAFATGLWLVAIKGGFKALPPRIHAGMGVTILIFAVGPFTFVALSRLGEALSRDDAAGVAASSRRFRVLAWIEELLRVAVLGLMVSPL
jgi:putative copper export protein